MARIFAAKEAVRDEEPLSIGMIGPPGGGKTLSSLRIAKGIQDERGGDIYLIDTEGGRSRKYADTIPFKCIEFEPPCKPEDFLEAIRQQLVHKPAAIIVDSMSDEHEGTGGYLEWHDAEIKNVGGNEWAAWAKPKASRKKLINGLLHIKTPLIFTFRAREKTKQQDKQGSSRKEIINIGWQPVAPLEIVHALDLTCILPPRADGVPVWKSDKIGEDFIIKLPNYLAPFIRSGQALDEQMGAAFARWARGDQVSPRTGKPASEAAGPAERHPDAGPAALDEETESERLARLDGLLDAAAKKGTAELQRAWLDDLTKDDRVSLQAAKDRRHKATASEADAAVIGN